MAWLLAYCPSIRHFGALRPTTGTMLRIGADISAIWLSFLVGWLLVAGNDLSTLIAQEYAPVIPLIGLFSIAACAAYTGAGLYTCMHSYTVAMKFRRIILVNLGFLLAGGAIWLAAKWAVVTIAPFLTMLLTSPVLLCLARAASLVLRAEDRVENRTGHQPADEKKVLVIGGAGYIGSTLVEKLLRLGLRVSVLDAMVFGEETLAQVAGHPNLTLIRDDFRHIEALTRAMSGVSAVIHLAGLVGDPACAVDPDLTIDINVTATKLVGEIAKARGVGRFIFASSCSVYGASEEIVNERSRLNPQSLYARTKIGAEAVLGALSDDEFAVTCLRFATIYGVSGRTRFDLVVNLLCAKAVRDGIITVSGPDQWRPFVHVDDVARAIVMTLQAPIDRVANEVFNVGSDAQNYTLGEVAALINRQVREARISCDSTDVDRRNYHVCFDKIRQQLGFEPTWSLESGIAQMIARVRSNEVGHYSLPTYSNVRLLQERGTKSFESFKIAGWEIELMSIDRIAFGKPADQSVAA